MPSSTKSQKARNRISLSIRCGLHCRLVWVAPGAAMWRGLIPALPKPLLLTTPSLSGALCCVWCWNGPLIYLALQLAPNRSSLEVMGLFLSSLFLKPKELGSLLQLLRSAAECAQEEIMVQKTAVSFLSLKLR